MLLWALTAPGQEEQVYRFLVKGTAQVSSYAPASAGGNLSEPANQQQRVQGCWDAKVPCNIAFYSTQVLGCFLGKCSFALPGSKLKGYSKAPVGAKPLAHFLLITILPNAP